MKVGVLALQGGVIEHVEMLKKIGVQPVLVKKESDLEDIDGIILPGGESTTIGRLLKIFNLLAPLKQKIQEGLPTYGTCAGLILLAKEVIGEDPYLEVMDISVKRNAYGRQLSSFTTNQVIKEIDESPIPLVFIRAPWIEKVGRNVQVLLELDGKIVCAKENNILVSSFHPELTNDERVHRYFIEMIKTAK